MSATIEQAAEWFENRAKATTMPGARSMFELAAVLLREKAERERGCEYCFPYNRKSIDSVGGTELEVVKITAMPAINLTTGQKEETEPRSFMALHVRLYDGEGEDFVPIRCCPMCGRELKEG